MLSGKYIAGMAVLVMAFMPVEVNAQNEADTQVNVQENTETHQSAETQGSAENDAITIANDEEAFAIYQQAT